MIEASKLFLRGANIIVTIFFSSFSPSSFADFTNYYTHLITYKT